MKRRPPEMPGGGWKREMFAAARCRPCENGQPFGLIRQERNIDITIPPDLDSSQVLLSNSPRGATSELGRTNRDQPKGFS